MKSLYIRPVLHVNSYLSLNNYANDISTSSLADNIATNPWEIWFE